MTAVHVASVGVSEPGRHDLTSVLHPRLASAGWEVLDSWEDDTGMVAATLAPPFGVVEPGARRPQDFDVMSLGRSPVRSGVGDRQDDDDGDGNGDDGELCSSEHDRPQSPCA